MKWLDLYQKQKLNTNFRFTASFSCYGKKGLMLRVLFRGVPMLGSLGTFGMFMYGIFLTGK